MRKSEIIFEKLRKKGEKYVNIKIKDPFIHNLYKENSGYDYDSVFNLSDDDYCFDFDYKSWGEKDLDLISFMQANKWEIDVLFDCYLSFNLNASDDVKKEICTLVKSGDLSNKVIAANILYKIKLII
jgi:hypothetical protein